MQVCQTRYFVTSLRRHDFRDTGASQTKLDQQVLEHYQHYTLHLLPYDQVANTTYSASAKMRKTHFLQSLAHGISETNEPNLEKIGRSSRSSNTLSLNMSNME
jgi:hypothetical protein